MSGNEVKKGLLGSFVKSLGLSSSKADRNSAKNEGNIFSNGNSTASDFFWAFAESAGQESPKTVQKLKQATAGLSGLSDKETKEKSMKPGAAVASIFSDYLESGKQPAERISNKIHNIFGVS